MRTTRKKPAIKRSIKRKMRRTYGILKRKRKVLTRRRKQRLGKSKKRIPKIKRNLRIHKSNATSTFKYKKAFKSSGGGTKRSLSDLNNDEHNKIKCEIHKDSSGKTYYICSKSKRIIDNVIIEKIIEKLEHDNADRIFDDLLANTGITIDDFNEYLNSPSSPKRMKCEYNSEHDTSVCTNEYTPSIEDINRELNKTYVPKTYDNKCNQLAQCNQLTEPTCWFVSIQELLRRIPHLYNNLHKDDRLFYSKCPKNNICPLPPKNWILKDSDNQILNKKEDVESRISDDFDGPRHELNKIIQRCPTLNNHITDNLDNLDVILYIHDDKDYILVDHTFVDHTSSLPMNKFTNLIQSIENSCKGFGHILVGGNITYENFTSSSLHRITHQITFMICNRNKDDYKLDVNKGIMYCNWGKCSSDINILKFGSDIGSSVNIGVDNSIYIILSCSVIFQKKEHYTKKKLSIEEQINLQTDDY